jgi:hypothetical protein
MSRIRTIKPEFFTHEDLFDAEQSTGLPLRLAFAGLWTQCDREGRFNWRHRQLKVAIMPYDSVDFSRVLDALTTRGFVVKYTSGTGEYGFIPSWKRHQVINNRERASTLPAPPENIEVFDASTTRDPRDDDAAQGEGKGRERKGKDSLSETSSDDPPKKKAERYPPDFEAFWLAYPRSPNMSKPKALVGWKKLSSDERAACSKAVPAYKAFLASKSDHPTMHATTFINERRFEGFAPAAEQPSAPIDDDRWLKRLAYARQKNEWPTAWGPRPGEVGCAAPAHLLEPTDGVNWTEMEISR